jgi:DNA-directed RNA polymerase subunit RPC12/RpoP
MDDKGYICGSCGKLFEYLAHFQEHISSSTACEKQKKKTILCDLCGSKFTSTKGLTNHKNNIHKIPRPSDKQKVFEQELEKMKARMTEIEKAKRKPGRPKKISSQVSTNNGNISTADTINNNTTNIGKQEINNQQIFIVQYGDEDISSLTDAEKKTILNSKYDAIKKCTEIMHCNPNHPELRNISITNLRSGTGLLYKNGKFRIRTKDGMLEDLIRDKANNVQEMLDEGGIIISKATRDKLTHLLELVNDNDEGQMKNLKQELEFLLYEENKSIH